MTTRLTPDCAWVADETGANIYAMRLPDGAPVALEGVAAIIFTDIVEGLDPIAEAMARWPEGGEEVVGSTRAFVDDLVAAGLVQVDPDPTRAGTAPAAAAPDSGPHHEPEPLVRAKKQSDDQPERSPARALGEPQPPSEPFRVLFVCTANICRSAYADAVASAAGVPGLEFASAGTHGWGGSPIDPPMAAELPPSVDASAHRGRQLTRDLLERADLVVTMAGEHRSWIQDEWPALSRKAFVMGQVTRELATLPDGATRDQVVEHLWRHRSQHAGDSVADPYRRGPEAAQACAARIRADLDVILDRLATLDLGGLDE